MIIYRKFINRKKAEKAAALLALNSAEQAESDRCLLAEEMAALVDDSCEQKERAIYLRHLSCCEHCYGQWLTLKKMADADAGGGHSDRLKKIKNYRSIGSALAVAASIAVFLNIFPPPYTFLDKTSEKALLKPPPEIESVATPSLKVAEEKMAVEADREQVEPMAPKVLDSLLKERSTTRDVPTDAKMKQKLQRKGLSAPATQPAPRPAKKGAPAGMAMEAELPEDANLWLERLQKNCLADRGDVHFWSQLHLQGEKILKNQSDTLSEIQKEKISTSLLLLVDMDEKLIPDRCRQLLELLAEEGENR